MRDDYTDITVILDRSGSMTNIKSDMEGGFNELVRSQKEVPGKALLTLIQFDDQYQVDCAAMDIRLVPPLRLIPRGSTALYDAIGKTIVRTGDRLRSIQEKDRPSKVLVVILTDGEENSSREYTRGKVFEMITHQKEKYGWEFIYMGANQDALKVGASFGISQEYSMTFAANSVGTGLAYDSFSSGVTNLRSASYVSGQGFFTADDRAQQTTAGVK